MKIQFSPPDINIDDINEVIDTLKSGWITTGPKTKLFEKEIAKLCGTNKAVCLNSATAGLELILRILGIGKGDEVIIPAYTYTASASIIDHVGATIKMIDTQVDSYEMNYDLLESAITKNTKAIIGVDLAGKIIDYDKIFEIVDKKKDIFETENIYHKKINRIAVIADGAHSLGAKKGDKMAGNIADFTSFSFHAVKNLTTAEGGAVTWKDNSLDDEEIYKQFMLYSLHGQTKDALSKTKIGSWEYDIAFPGYKCNMTDIMASLGISQLKRYDSILERRQEIIRLYENNLNKDIIKFIHQEKNNISSGHLYLIRLKGFDETKRNQVIEKLAEKGIPANVHYKPLPMLTAYKNLGFDIKNYPNAYNLYKNTISLPLHTKLSDEEVLYICNELNTIYSECK